MENENKELFNKCFQAEDKDACLDFVISRLHSGEISIYELYEGILAPALNSLKICPQDESNCIWKEHVKTSIIRTIIECCYPFIARAKKDTKKVGIMVLVFCPENELHEIGARMVTDFFTLSGFDAIFIGANTPREQIKVAIDCIKPGYVAISVTDYYNLVAAKKAIDLIKTVSNGKTKVLVGGNAFRDNMELVAQIGADAYLESYEDVRRLGEEVLSNETGI